MRQASEKKKNNSKNTRARPDLLLHGTFTTRQRREEFAKFWEGILVPQDQEQQQQQQDGLLKGDNTIEDLISTVFEGEADDYFSTTHVEFLEMLARVPLGKAGGQEWGAGGVRPRSQRRPSGSALGQDNCDFTRARRSTLFWETSDCNAYTEHSATASTSRLPAHHCTLGA